MCWFLPRGNTHASTHIQTVQQNIKAKRPPSRKDKDSFLYSQDTLSLWEHVENLTWKRSTPCISLFTHLTVSHCINICVSCDKYGFETVIPTRWVGATWCDFSKAWALFSIQWVKVGIWVGGLTTSSTSIKPTWPSFKNSKSTFYFLVATCTFSDQKLR